MTRATSPLITRWRRDCAKELRRRPLVAPPVASEIACVACGWRIEGEARRTELGLTHVACADAGEAATRGGS
jgi:hypothetical protein